MEPETINFCYKHYTCPGTVIMLWRMDSMQSSKDTVGKKNNEDTMTSEQLQILHNYF